MELTKSESTLTIKEAEHPERWVF